MDPQVTPVVAEACPKCGMVTAASREYPVRFLRAGCRPPRPSRLRIFFGCDCGYGWMREVTVRDLHGETVAAGNTALSPRSSPG
jgi:hypothetical protein